jgi:glycerol uptake facilitator-like aquaporin
MTDAPPARLRRVLAEFLGSGLIAAIVIGSGIAASRLSPDDVGLQLLENAIATALGLFVLITVFAPVSGAHFNPVVSLVDAALGYRPWGSIALYLPAQLLGCIGGAVLANAIFALARSGRAALAPASVAAYIGAAYFFTASTSFANPAITVGRMFSDTFAGIAPVSVGPFVGAQLLGGALGLLLIRLLYPKRLITERR